MEDIATKLGSSGLCIVPHFLSSALIQALLIDLKHVKKAGNFTRAGTGQGNTREVRNLIRRDEIFWLDEVMANLVQQQLWDKINALKQAFNRMLFLGLSEFEGHYASYPKGGFYKKHLDSFQADPSRVVSLIIYLNQSWQAKDGGLLRVYANGRSTDIEPLAGTLVCFLSHELVHEVLLSHKTRLSFSGWFKSLA
ncbi:MAG TPA: 2OG-Fe(II) oxygenase [Candidatus Obscuribacterales bacterium]